MLHVPREKLSHNLFECEIKIHNVPLQSIFTNIIIGSSLKMLTRFQNRWKEPKIRENIIC